MGQHISLFVMAHNCDKNDRSVRKNIEAAVITGSIAVRAVKAPHLLALCVKTHDYEVVVGVALHVHGTAEDCFAGIRGGITGAVRGGRAHPIDGRAILRGLDAAGHRTRSERTVYEVCPFGSGSGGSCHNGGRTQKHCC